MNKKPEPGKKKTMLRIVEKTDTAAHFGSGHLEVLATPALIGYLENVAMNLVSPFLNDSQNTVGTEISVKHIKATPVGKKISCTATLEQISGRKLVFKVEAHEGKSLIGFGQHTRYIIDVKRFMNALNSD